MLEFSYTGHPSAFGGVVAANVTDQGGTKVHNDRKVNGSFFSAGNFMLSSFSWKKF